MAIIRWFLGKLILFFDALFSPKVMQRTPVEQSRLESLVKDFAIYQYEACPFCVKVRRYLRRVNISIAFRDAKKSPFREELLEQGGKAQVPCLRILNADGSIRWLYESNDIIAYLNGILRL